MRYVPNIIVDVYNNSPIVVKNLFANIYSFYKLYKERNKYYYEGLKYLKYFEHATSQHILDYQNKVFIGIYRHAFNNVPFYRKLYNEYGLNDSSIKDINDINKLPIITKDDIYKNFTLFRSKKPVRLQFIAQTSGTTGKPLQVEIDPLTDGYHNTLLDYQSIIYNCHGDWYGTLAGYKIIPPNRNTPPYWISNFPRKQVHFSSYHLNKNTYLKYIDYIKKKNITYLRGYPSIIGRFAQLLNDNSIHYSLKAVITSSQPLEPWIREAIYNAFYCKVFELYGIAERNVAAITCEYGHLHLVPIISYCEFKETKELGKFQLITTTLTNLRMPLIRYELDDLTEPLNIKCKCGRPWTIIRPIESRRGDFFITKSGKLIPAPAFTIAFWGLNGILEAQIHQIEIDKAILRINPDNNYDVRTGDTVINKLKQISNNEIDFELHLTDEFYMGNTGKRPFIVRNKDIQDNYLF